LFNRKGKKGRGTSELKPDGNPLKARPTFLGDFACEQKKTVLPGRGKKRRVRDPAPTPPRAASCLGEKKKEKKRKGRRTPHPDGKGGKKGKTDASEL